MHKNGYTMARMIETQSDGKVHVMVAGAEMVVDVTDVDKANPSNMDRMEDLARFVSFNSFADFYLFKAIGSILITTLISRFVAVCLLVFMPLRFEGLRTSSKTYRY